MLPYVYYLCLVEFLVTFWIPKLHKHPAVKALTSDWSINCFIMVVYEKTFCSRALDRTFWLNFKNILTDNHYKSLYRQVKVRSECSSWRVIKANVTTVQCKLPLGCNEMWCMYVMLLLDISVNKFVGLFFKNNFHISNRVFPRVDHSGSSVLDKINSAKKLSLTGIKLKSIEHDYIWPFKVSVFRAMGISIFYNRC